MPTTRSHQKHLKINYKGHVLEYFFQPSLWMSVVELLEIKKKLDYVNEVANKNYSFGVLNKTIETSELVSFFKKMNICIIYNDNVPVGFIYDVIIREKDTPIIVCGLAMISKNKGLDLTYFPRLFLIVHQYKLYGKYYYSGITSIPAMVEVFSKKATNVWPNHRSSNFKFAPKKYLSVLSWVFKEYAEVFFKNVELNQKRFVMTTIGDNDFELDLRKLSRATEMNVNLFCMYWIDTSKNEDIIMIGVVNSRKFLMHRASICIEATKEKIRNLFIFLANR